MDAETATESTAESFEWLSLDDDETVLWSGKPHVYSIVPALVVGIPLSLVLVGIPIVVGAYLSRENTVYLLTTEGLYRKRGILSRDVQKIEFEKVQNISFSQGALGTYVGYGNVDISTAGGSGIEMQFRAVADPKAVQEQINRRIRRSRSDGREEEPEARRADDVLDDILTELRAIRAALDDERNGGDERSDGDERNGGDERSDGDGEPDAVVDTAMFEGTADDDSAGTDADSGGATAEHGHRTADADDPTEGVDEPTSRE